MISKKHIRVLTVFTLAMINVAAVLNLSRLSILAEYGLSAIFFIGAAAILFFLPAALVSAELATGWPKRGGVYVWVKEAFGNDWGFLAIWLQWFENVIWYPTALSAAAAAFAFAINPYLAINPWYNSLAIIAVMWIATFANFRGMRLSGLISSSGVIIGTIIPAVLVILLGAYWIANGLPSQIDLSLNNIVPNLGDVSNLVFLIGLLLGFAGIEMSAVHAEEVKDPARDYPKALLLSVIIILALSVFGSLAIAIVVPKESILLSSGIMEAFQAFFTQYNITWIIPFVAVAVAFGFIGAVSTWIIGPCKGLLATAREGDLPPFFKKINNRGVPVNVLILQAIVVTILSLIFLVSPSINSAYWVLIVLTAQLYIIMYVLMFAAAVKLRYSQPKVKRPYVVPGGKFGIWLVSGIGILSCLVAFIFGFIPPPQFNNALLVFIGFLLLSIIITCAIPFVILHFRKEEWKS